MGGLERESGGIADDPLVPVGQPDFRGDQIGTGRLEVEPGLDVPPLRAGLGGFEGEGAFDRDHADAVDDVAASRFDVEVEPVGGGAEGDRASGEIGDADADGEFLAGQEVGFVEDHFDLDGGGGGPGRGEGEKESPRTSRAPARGGIRQTQRMAGDYGWNRRRRERELGPRKD